MSNLEKDTRLPKAGVLDKTEAPSAEKRGRGRPALTPEDHISALLGHMMMLPEKKAFRLLRDEMMVPKTRARQAKTFAALNKTKPKKKPALLPKAKTYGKRGRPALTPEDHISAFLGHMMTLSEKEAFRLLRDEMMVPKAGTRQAKGPCVLKEKRPSESLYKVGCDPKPLPREDAKLYRHLLSSGTPSLEAHYVVPEPKNIPVDPSADPFAEKDSEILAAAEAFLAFVSTQISKMHLTNLSLNKNIRTRLFEDWIYGTDFPIKKHQKIERIGKHLIRQGHLIDIPTKYKYNSVLEIQARRGGVPNQKPRQQEYEFY